MESGVGIGLQGAPEVPQMLAGMFIHDGAVRLACLGNG